MSRSSSCDRSLRKSYGKARVADPRALRCIVFVNRNGLRWRDAPSAFGSHKTLYGGRGYDADWFRNALRAKGIQPCIPGRRSRNEPGRYDKRRYQRRSCIEIMFGCPKLGGGLPLATIASPAFFAAVALAATVMSWP